MHCNSSYCMDIWMHKCGCCHLSIYLTHCMCVCVQGDFVTCLMDAVGVELKKRASQLYRHNLTGIRICHKCLHYDVKSHLLRVRYVYLSLQVSLRVLCALATPSLSPLSSSTGSMCVCWRHRPVSLYLCCAVCMSAVMHACCNACLL